MQTPLFSIIVPVYKAEQYLHQCVDSILNQSFDDFQVVLVDDGSPDGSGAICDEYARRDSRVTVIHKENGGPGNARRTALTQCRGEYVAFVDSDDYIAPDHLEHFAEKIRMQGPDVLMCGAMCFSDQGQSPKRRFLSAGYYDGANLETIHRNILCADNTLTTIPYELWAFVIKRGLYAQYQQPAPGNLRRGEDVAVTVPMLAACTSVSVLEHRTYFYRNNPTSLMNTFRLMEAQEMKELASYLRKTMDAVYHRKIDIYVATHYFDFLDRAMLAMSYGEYRKLVRQTLDKELYGYLVRAKCKANPMWQIVFALMKCRLFGLLWILRKIRKRKV